MKCLSQPQGEYHSLGNACQNPIQGIVSFRLAGNGVGNSITPFGLMEGIMNGTKQLYKGPKYYPAIPPSH